MEEMPYSSASENIPEELEATLEEIKIKRNLYFESLWNSYIEKATDNADIVDYVQSIIMRKIRNVLTGGGGLDLLAVSVANAITGGTFTTGPTLEDQENPGNEERLSLVAKLIQKQFPNLIEDYLKAIEIRDILMTMVPNTRDPFQWIGRNYVTPQDWCDSRKTALYDFNRAKSLLADFDSIMEKYGVTPQDCNDFRSMMTYRFEEIGEPLE